MNPISHLLVGWTLSEEARCEPHDRAIVTWAGVVPDIDGLTMVPDFLNRWLGRTETDYYFRYHHVLTHGLPAALLTTAVAAALGGRKVKTAVLAFASFHLHLLGDLVGSRGPTAGDVWPVGYLEPFSSKLTFAWSGHWPVNDWRNIVLTLVLLALVFIRAIKHGYSPVGFFSGRADSVFVATLRARFVRPA